MRLPVVICIAGCFTATTLLADFSYQQTSRVTGGAMASMMRVAGVFSSRVREPMTSTVIVKGHRMAHLSANSAQIIDVDGETITNIDYAKKTYSVMTFQQMKQMMQDMAQRMGQKADESNVNFKASVRETGQSKVVAGLNAKDVILTLTMEGTDQKTGQQGDLTITSDIWLAPEIPGYGEVRDLYRAMAKAGWSPGQSFGSMMGRSGMMKGMAEAGKEMANLEGVPVLSVMTVSGSGSGTPGENSGRGQAANSSKSNDTNSQPGAAEALKGLGRLGGIGGFGRRKKDTDSGSPASTPSGSESAGANGVLMEITTESTGFSSAPVDASKFDIPAGFQQVDPEMGRRSGRR